MMNNKTNRVSYFNVEDIPLVLRVDDLMSILGIGRNAAYSLVHSRQVRSIRIGSQIRIPRDALVEYLTKATA